MGEKRSGGLADFTSGTAQKGIEKLAQDRLTNSKTRPTGSGRTWAMEIRSER
ncbi:MAG: hypothetical protein MZU91_05120 [Desulfosudis oleivorans]|nr:hypothetical protein [Desulfosudis oleivorans]